MSITQPKSIQSWKIVPSTEGTVSLVGIVGGVAIQSSPICFARPGEIRTENSHYILGSKLPGVWEIQLEMKRPEKVANLRKLGVL